MKNNKYDDLHKKLDEYLSNTPPSKIINDLEELGYTFSPFEKEEKDKNADVPQRSTGPHL